jgi:hypothetical protein
MHLAFFEISHVPDRMSCVSSTPLLIQSNVPDLLPCCCMCHAPFVVPQTQARMPKCLKHAAAVAGVSDFLEGVVVVKKDCYLLASVWPCKLPFPVIQVIVIVITFVVWLSWLG